MYFYLNKKNSKRFSRKEEMKNDIQTALQILSKDPGATALALTGARNLGWGVGKRYDLGTRPSEMLGRKGKSLSPLLCSRAVGC